MYQIRRMFMLAIILAGTALIGGCSFLRPGACPVEITDLQMGSYYGTTTAAVAVKNIGTKELKGFTVDIDAWNVMGEKLIPTGFDEYGYFGLYDGTIPVGQEVQGSWRIYGYETAHKLEARISKTVDESGKVRVDSWGTCNTKTVTK